MRSRALRHNFMSCHELRSLNRVVKLALISFPVGCWLKLEMTIVSGIIVKRTLQFAANSEPLSKCHVSRVASAAARSNPKGRPSLQRMVALA